MGHVKYKMLAKFDGCTEMKLQQSRNEVCGRILDWPCVQNQYIFKRTIYFVHLHQMTAHILVE
jgi:hypothetical protein